MSSTTRDKRLRKVQRRAIPEVAALQRGQISARRADILLYLPPAQQLAELSRRLQATEERTRKARLAAQVIAGYLDTARQIDLEELRCRLGAALARA